ncbi:MAG: SIR2 family protein [Lachnospiraceae bacterium]|nr:SIR2 family protein [Lachnospiraceae bacterium]
MNIEDVVEKFNTTPFLFLGSGMTRRYYNLPDWKGLLEHFAREIRDDDFAYSVYENRASKLETPVGLLPKVAELIQADYDEKWFNDASIRNLEEDSLMKVKAGLSPFKAEIASYIKRNCVVVDEYKTEIEMLSKLSEKNVAGVITTNYDEFVENNFIGYTKFIGQKQLIFSAIQGIAEIYKIHGSVEDPDSLVINEQDYLGKH